MLSKIKIFVPAFLLALAMAAGLYIFLEAPISRSFSQLEKLAVTRSNERVEYAVDNFMKNLKAHVGDWARWDTSWEAMGEAGNAQREEFYRENVSDDALKTLNVNLICFVDLSGKVALAKGIDLKKVQDSPEAEKYCAEALKHKQFLDLPTVDASYSGFVDIESQPPLALVSQSIVRTDGSGPSHGTLVFARFIDDEVIGYLRSASIFPTVVKKVSDSDLSPDFKIALNNFKGGRETYIYPQDEHIIFGYSFFKSADGRPLFMARVEMQREISQQNTVVSRLLFFAAIAVFLLFLSIAMLLTVYFNASKAREVAQACRVRSDELEELNKLMVGRETRMVELKKEIKKLKRKSVKKSR